MEGEKEIRNVSTFKQTGEEQSEEVIPQVVSTFVVSGSEPLSTREEVADVPFWCPSFLCYVFFLWVGLTNSAPRGRVGRGMVRRGENFR